MLLMVHGTHPYSHKAAIAHAQEHLIGREKTLARYSEDFEALHPNESRDARKPSPSYVELETRIKLKFSKNKDKLEKRRIQAGGKP